MKNPFRKKMPLGLDIKIRLRIFRAYLASKRSVLGAFGVGLMVPVIATYMLVINTDDAPTVVNTQAIVAAVQSAQKEEIKKSETGIYHVKRVISEGNDKPDFVAFATKQNIPTVPVRVDTVETWQHNETALALVESNGTNYGFEAFLSVEHDGGLQLHHYGEDKHEIDGTREAYDKAHDLASLYTSYKSLERPDVPVLPEAATFKNTNESATLAYFTHSPAAGLEIEYAVDLNSNLVVEEVIYVLTEDAKRFEMTRVAYTERDVVPAEKFDEVFNPSQFDYEMIESLQTT